MNRREDFNFEHWKNEASEEWINEASAERNNQNNSHNPFNPTYVGPERFGIEAKRWFFLGFNLPHQMQKDILDYLSSFELINGELDFTADLSAIKRSSLPTEFKMSISEPGIYVYDLQSKAIKSIPLPAEKEDVFAFLNEFGNFYGYRKNGGSNFSLNNLVVPIALLFGYFLMKR